MPADYGTIEVNGREADQAAVSLLEHEGWGHFTAMQVRASRARGLDLHLARLEAAHHHIYGRRSMGRKSAPGSARPRRPGGHERPVYGYWAGLIVTVKEPQDTPPSAFDDRLAIPAAAGPAQARRQLGQGPVQRDGPGRGL